MSTLPERSPTILARFIPLIGRTALVDNGTFKRLLQRAGREDPVMRQTQDVFFDRVYFQPALKWANEHGFTQALSMLVIYELFIHSGGILDFLRARFHEKPPVDGGDEKVWISEYVQARHNWLATNSNEISSFHRLPHEMLHERDRAAGIGTSAGFRSALTKCPSTTKAPATAGVAPSLSHDGRARSRTRWRQSPTSVRTGRGGLSAMKAPRSGATITLPKAGLCRSGRGGGPDDCSGDCRGNSVQPAN